MDDLEIEVGLKVVRKKNGRWKVVELHLPAEISEEDFEDITSCWWYAFGQRANRKCPSIIAAWEFNGDPAWVMACQQPNHEKQKSFRIQLKELVMTEDLLDNWDNR
ncbi:hypothetical protein AN618_18620 [Fervidicola ferrireducens]|uniref:Uncharacterized protein n=2 Tax=Fervidicola ferrireducens TaxID=520764 RepID=A0A140L4L9_9FIRM|nr:hypothetical protein AN618_18620 [Fervidicola ferrireducens]